MNRLREYLIKLLGGRQITVVVIEKNRGTVGVDSVTFHYVKAPQILKARGKTIKVHPGGEVEVW